MYSILNLECLLHVRCYYLKYSLTILMLIYYFVYVGSLCDSIFSSCFISELCKSKDASNNVIELLSWHKFISQRRISTAIVENNSGICREGHRPTRYHISRAGIVFVLFHIQQTKGGHCNHEVSCLCHELGSFYCSLC